MVKSIAASVNPAAKRRTSIVVLNAYPVESVPFMLPYLTPDIRTVTDKFNSILAVELSKLKVNLTETVHLTQADVTSVIRNLINQPPKGVSTNTSCVVGDVTSSSVTVCDNPSKYIYYDTFHPTEWVHKKIADAVEAASSTP